MSSMPTTRPPRPTVDTYERSSKRRRLSEDYASSDTSRDELALSPVTPRPQKRRSTPKRIPSLPSSRASSRGSTSRYQTPDEQDARFLHRKTPDYKHVETPDSEHIKTPDSEHIKTPKSEQINGPASSGTADSTDSGSHEDTESAAHSPRPPSPALPIRYRQKLILRGHKRGVSAVKFSPDGKWIASCSADATIKVWSSTTGAHQATLHGHLAGISTLAWSPDSLVLATGSDDKSIRLWTRCSSSSTSCTTSDATAWTPHPHPLQGHHNSILCLAFSPKGNMLVSGSTDEAVHLWSVRSGRLLRSLPAHSDPVHGVDFVRDGTLIASCSSDGLIRVWDTATGQCLRTFFHEDTPAVAAVRFCPNGRYILAWMLDSRLRMWDYVEGKCVKTYEGHRNERFSVIGAFGTYGGGDGRGEVGDRRAFVVSGSEDGAVLLWDVVSKRVLQRLEGHEETVFGVDTHPTEKMLVTCGADRTVRLWRDDSSFVRDTANNDDA